MKVWKEADLELAFDAWKGHMEHHYKRVLVEQLPELAKNISTDSGLFNKLQSKKVFDRRVLETFEVGWLFHSSLLSDHQFSTLTMTTVC